MFLAELDTRGWSLGGIWLTHADFAIAYEDEYLSWSTSPPGSSCIPRGGTRRDGF